MGRVIAGGVSFQYISAFYFMGSFGVVGFYFNVF